VMRKSLIAKDTPDISGVSLLKDEGMLNGTLNTCYGIA